MYFCPELKGCGTPSLSPAIDSLQPPSERYLSALQPTFFCHAEGKEYGEQAMPNAHVLKNKTIK
jgi:hypothetical protein